MAKEKTEVSSNGTTARLRQGGQLNGTATLVEEQQTEVIHGPEEKEEESRPVTEVVRPTSSSGLLHGLSHAFHRSLSYLTSLRPSSFTTSLTPVLMGAILAYKATGQFSWVTLGATLLTVLSVHAAGNLVNTYIDFKRGIDSERTSDDRTLVDSILTPDQVANLGVLFYFFGCIFFFIVVYSSPARMVHLALVYFGGISFSFLYTGGGLKYIALGDIIIMIMFGPVSILFSFIAQTGTFRMVTLLYALPLALNTEAILHSNNTRDIDEDRAAGCVTIASLIGHRASHVFFAFLLFVPYILFMVTALHGTCWVTLPLLTLPKAFHLEREFRKRDLQTLPQQMARLSRWFGTFYLLACYLAPPQDLPFLISGSW